MDMDNLFELRIPVPSDKVRVTKLTATTKEAVIKAGQKWIKQNGQNCFARSPIIVRDDETWYAVIQWVAYY